MEEKTGNLVIKLDEQGLFVSNGLGQYTLTLSGQVAINEALKHKEVRAHYNKLVDNGCNQQIARLVILLALAERAESL